MRLDFSTERALAVVAHPDDAEYLCAGTLARAEADGAAIGVCVLCQGDKGQPTTPIPNLADVTWMTLHDARTGKFSAGNSWTRVRISSPPRKSLPDTSLPVIPDRKILSR